MGAVFAVVVGLGTTPQIFATDANNFIWGADSQDSNSSLTGARSEITIQSSTT